MDFLLEKKDRHANVIFRDNGERLFTSEVLARRFDNLSVEEIRIICDRNGFKINRKGPDCVVFTEKELADLVRRANKTVNELHEMNESELWI